MKNYFAYSFLITFVIIIIMIGLSFIPPGTVKGVDFKQINILSDVFTSNDLRGLFGLKPIEMFDKIDSSALSDVDRALEGADRVLIDSLVTDSCVASCYKNYNIDSLRAIPCPDSVIRIEDYSDEGYSLMPFYDDLAKIVNGKAVHIAVMGDSYIEGDIMTADLRDAYQQKYSGNGVGFVPLYSQTSKFRKTIDHNSTGWTQHSILKESKRGDYMISKYSFTPDENAVVEYKIRGAHRSVQRSTFVFVNNKHTQIQVTTNGSNELLISPDSSDLLQASVVRDSISTIKYSVNQVEGFIGYGVYLNDTTGVYVDNYAVRGSSGIFIALMNENLCKELNQIVPVNLIVLQYGLNIASGKELNFKHYKTKMVKVINKIKSAFPGVPILMMGVPDQSIKVDGAYVSNPSIALLEKYQREIAQETKIAFWSTLSAVKSLGGMDNFVKMKWASKDYTHVNAKGGKKIAEKLFVSLEHYNPKTCH